MGSQCSCGSKPAVKDTRHNLSFPIGSVLNIIQCNFNCGPVMWLAAAVEARYFKVVSSLRQYHMDINTWGQYDVKNVSRKWSLAKQFGDKNF